MDSSINRKKPQSALSIVKAAATETDVAKAVLYAKKLADFMKVPSDHITAKTMRTVLESGAGQALFGMDGERTIAFLYYYETAPALLGTKGIYIDMIYVDEAYRGSGIGKQMMDYLAKLAQDKGFGRLEWTCFDWNEQALGFYRKMGAKTMDTIILHRMKPEEMK